MSLDQMSLAYIGIEALMAETGRVPAGGSVNSYGRGSRRLPRIVESPGFGRRNRLPYVIVTAVVGYDSDEVRVRRAEYYFVGAGLAPPATRR